MSQRGRIPREQFGKTGIQLSALGLGGRHLGDAEDLDTAKQIVDNAFDGGVNFFDNCCECHRGKSEVWLGREGTLRRSEIYGERGTQMNFPTRRDLLGTMAAASIGGALLGLQRSGYDAEASEPRRERVDFEPIRNRILQAIAHREATGVAVAVAHDGRIVWEEGFGWANREAGLKATSRTPFCLASITKPFTTAMLMTLAAEGKVSLDEPANNYLAKTKIESSDFNPDGATVRLLGAHASGLPTMFEAYFPDRAAQAPKPNTLLRDYGRLAYPPGSVYEYSNIGFDALGVIASKLTGTDFGTLLTRRVLEPLELHDSFFDTRVERLATRAVGYDSSGIPIPYYTTSTPPSGELYASARDLARFAMFNMKNHVNDRAQFLADQWIDELQKPVFIGPSGVTTTFGWFSGQLKSGVPVIFKTGGQPGVATLLYMIPSKNLACLVLTNRSDGQDLTHSVCGQILASYLPGSTPPPENAGPSPAAFIDTRGFGGPWEGMLTNDGANMRVRLEIGSSASPTLALGENPAEKITEMQSEGMAFTGMTAGSIESADSIRHVAKTLKIKLVRHEEKLVGRILAEGGQRGSMYWAMLPYVLTLNRRSS